MSTLETDRRVDDYLQRLEKATAHLPRSRRVELVAEIREHIETALEREDASSETAVRNILERLGEPEEIVAEAQPSAGDGTGKVGAVEIVALVALVVPVVGWLVGIVLVLVSGAWSNRDKLIGIGLALIPALVPLLVLVLGAESSTAESVPVGDEPPTGATETGDDGLGPLELGTLVIGFLAGLPSALYLGLRLQRE